MQQIRFPVDNYVTAATYTADGDIVDRTMIFGSFVQLYVFLYVGFLEFREVKNDIDR